MRKTTTQGALFAFTHRGSEWPLVDCTWSHTESLSDNEMTEPSSLDTAEGLFERGRFLSSSLSEMLPRFRCGSSLLC